MLFPEIRPKTETAPKKEQLLFLYFASGKHPVIPIITLVLEVYLPNSSYFRTMTAADLTSVIYRNRIVCMNDVLIFSYKLVRMEQKYFEGLYRSTVLCSSELLKDSDFDWIPHRLLLEFMDTQIQRMDAFQPEQVQRTAAF